MLFLLKPETVRVALFLDDSAGLYLFLMLIEVQIFAVVRTVVSYYIKLNQAYTKKVGLHRVYTHSWSNFRAPQTQAFVTLSQATVKPQSCADWFSLPP